MRILLDHNTPAPLRYALGEHSVELAYERGWAELTNGDLLAAVESSRFDLMITTDKSIRYQQNLAGRKLALLVLSTNDWSRIRKCTNLVASAILSLQSGAYLALDIPRK